jgi:protein-L-isoaspartate(D-aspartate) O-methyltransferase
LRSWDNSGAAFIILASAIAEAEDRPAMALNAEAARREMIENQLVRRGITSARVLDAMAAVPRELFMGEGWREEAYTDRAAPIDCGQTISQPYIVALMTEALNLRGDESVLEIGTGSGYQAAILSRLARRVVSIERHEALSRKAEKALNQIGCDNVQLIVGDGTLGYPPLAPYDRIIITAAAEQLPAALAEQLADGGWIVVPLGSEEHQVLQALHKRGADFEHIVLTPCRFVPLIHEGRGE